MSVQDSTRRTVLKGFRSVARSPYTSDRQREALRELERELRGSGAFAEARHATYCGPGSGGDRSEIIVAIRWSHGFELRTVA